MKKDKLYTLLMLGCLIIFLVSCTKDNEIVPYPTDITFNDIALDEFTYVMQNAPFTAGDAESGIIIVNAVDRGNGRFSGFAISNRNLRNYPWNLSKTFAPVGGLTAEQRIDEINSTIMSCYTYYTNKTENFLVGTATDNDAFITLNTPAVVEHVLVANSSFTFLTTTYGSIYSTNNTLTGGVVANPNIGNLDVALKGVFLLPTLDSVNLIKRTTTEWLKLTINGYNNNVITGSVDFFLFVGLNGDPNHLTYNYVLDRWRVVDLTSLGKVDKLVFNITGSQVNAVTGKPVRPPYFCLDGIRIQK